METPSASSSSQSFEESLRPVTPEDAKLNSFFEESSSRGVSSIFNRSGSLTSDHFDGSFVSTRKRPRVSSILDGSIGEGSDRPTEAMLGRKRPRVSSILSGTIATGPDRLPSRPRSFLQDDEDVSSIFTYPHSRPLSRSSSFIGGSRAGTPPLPLEPPLLGSGHISRTGMALLRSASSSSLNSAAAAQKYPELSAKYFLRNTKVTIDYTMPPVDTGIDPHLLSCSVENVLFFSRGNRVHYKQMTASEEVGQLCKIQDSHGNLISIQCAGADQPNIVALGTSKGYVQIWDVKTRKSITSWSTKGISAMCWNGPVLSIGSLKGTIKHYDTRIDVKAKMKEQARKVTRHQARITSLSWNVDGKILASGDLTGTVYCWEPGQRVPLDVGEFVQRRKKIQHNSAISALAWCPWQPKLLATGDANGVLRLWTINATIRDSNAMTPGKLELGSSITGMHFSPHCKEILTTHGSVIPASELEWPKIPISMANTVSVHSYPSLRHVTTLPVSNKPIGDSVLNVHGTKVVFAVPEENKLNVCEVWRKEIKRQSSFMNTIR